MPADTWLLELKADCDNALYRLADGEECPHRWCRELWEETGWEPQLGG